MPRRLITADSIRTADGLEGDAVLTENGRIVALGSASQLRSPSIPETAYPGATIVPGLRDAHLHPVGYAAALRNPNLKNASDFNDIVDLLSAAMQTQPPYSGLTALRLDDETLAEQRLPDRHLLDAVSPGRPILAIRYCGHVVVANTAALALAGITGDTSDPTDGTIDRDDSGEPTGVLRETAGEPVITAMRPLAPPLTPEHVAESLLALASTGLTGVGAMAATHAGLWGGTASELEVLLAAAATSPITLNVFVIAPNPAALRAAALRITDAPGPVRFAGAKMFSDGSLGGHTAALHDPYTDQPTTRGTDRLDRSWAEEMARTSLDLGGSVAIHAIGDRANSGVLDLMEHLIAGGTDPSRLRVEHASVLTAPDIVRCGHLGITVSVQPAFIASETEWLEKRLGSDRTRRTYPFRSLTDTGAILAGGSDCPVEPPHPLHGMAAAVDRLGFVPSEALTPVEALALFTTGAANAIGETASFEANSPASMTVLDGDPAAGNGDALRSAEILATWVNGEPVEVPAGIIAWQG